MQKTKLLYSGKAKSVYECDSPEHVIIEFRNDTSAFNGVKLAKLDEKGKVNNKINDFLMRYLESKNIKTHHEKLLSDDAELVKRLDMLPVECVVRNVAAGSLSKRLGIEEGTVLSQPIFEFFLKDDELGDPFINDSHIEAFGWATQKQADEMRTLTLKVNDLLLPLFREAGMQLVDYKLEFGLFKGELYLGDELTPDGCRIWDINTQEKMDKDRFRRDLGDVVEYYKEVGQRLGVELD